MRTNITRIAIYFLIALPIAINLLFTLRFSVDVPFSDDWRNVPYIEHFFNGTLTPALLFEQHGEHRPFFGLLINVILAQLTQYNIIVQILVSWIFLVFTYCIIVYLYIKTFGRSTQALAAFIPISYLFFNVRQVQTLIRANEDIVTLALAASLLSIVLIHRDTWRSFYAALFFAIVASFSFIIGLFVWPVCALYYFLHAHKRNIWSPRCILWVLSGFAVWVLYFYSWTYPTVHPPQFFFLNHIVEAALFFIALFGSPYTQSLLIAIIVGLTILTLLVLFLYKSCKYKQTIPSEWIYIGIFFVTVALSLVIGRLGFGVSQALETRYVTFTMFFSILLYLIILYIQRTNRGVAMLTVNGLLVVALFIGLALASRSAVRIATIEQKLMLDTVNFLTAYPDIPYEKAKANLPLMTEKSIQFLIDKKLSVFRSRL